jgi:cytoskeleton protein RodZ
MNENRAMSKTESSDASAGPELKSEHHAVSSTEKHPNLTLLESGQNPGEILRAAREKAGYSLSDISAQTKINEKQLEAIESGDVGRLPPETFAKAFIKSYCKALKIDSAPIILSFGFAEASAQPKVARPGQSEGTRAEPFEPKMPSSSKRLSSLNFDRKSGKKSLSYGIVLAALAVMAVFYIPVFMANQEAQTSDSEVIDPNEAPATAIGADTPVSPQPEVPADASLASPLATPGSTGDTTVFPALQQPAAVEPSVAAAPATPAAPVAPAASPVVAEPQTSVAAPVAGQGVLKFNFQEQSWVTVRDANDQVLISQLNDGGSNLEVRGQGPFKLIVGNAKAVTVSSNGKPVDLSTSIRGEVARVTVQ